jgi:hypothetical protein
MRSLGFAKLKIMAVGLDALDRIPQLVFGQGDEVVDKKNI